MTSLSSTRRQDRPAGAVREAATRLKIGKTALYDALANAKSPWIADPSMRCRVRTKGA